MTRALTVTDAAGLAVAACLDGQAAGELCTDQVCGDPSCCTPFCTFRSETVPGVGFSRPVLRSYSVTSLFISYGRATGISRFAFRAESGVRPGTPSPGTPSVTVPHEPQFPPVAPGCVVAGPLPFGDAPAPAEGISLGSILNISPASYSEIVGELVYLYQLVPLPTTHRPRPTGPEGLDQYLLSRDVFDRRRAVLNTLTGLLRIEHELTIGGDDTPSNQRATLRIEITVNLQTSELSGRASVGAYGVEIPPDKLALDPLGTECNPVVMVGGAGVGGFPGSFNFAVPFIDGDAAVTISERYSIVRQVTSLGGEIVFIPSQPSNPDAGNCPAECCPAPCGYVRDQPRSCVLTTGPVASVSYVSSPATSFTEIINSSVGALNTTLAVQDADPASCVRGYGITSFTPRPPGLAPVPPNGIVIRQVGAQVTRQIKGAASGDSVNVLLRAEDFSFRHFGYSTVFEDRGEPGVAGLAVEVGIEVFGDGFVQLSVFSGTTLLRQRTRTIDYTHPIVRALSVTHDPCLNSVQLDLSVEDLGQTSDGRLSGYVETLRVRADFGDQAVPCSTALPAGARAKSAGGCAGCIDPAILAEGVPA